MRRALPLLVLAGCLDVEKPVLSSDVASGDLSLPLTVVTTPSAIEVRVSVQGPGGGVTLMEGDRLVVRVGDRALEPQRVERGSWVARTGLDAYGDVVARVERADDASVEARAYLPPPFRVTVPATASRAASLTVRWDAASGPYATTLSVGGPCVAPIVRPLSSDVGTYTFNPYELASSAAAPGSCTATVTLSKASPSASTPTASRTALATFVSEP
jgi:hypothetical protein